MSSSPQLDGVTVLDLSSVGPASRCSRILADYGATVVKVGPPPRKAGLQIQPKFFAYSAHRDMKRARFDLKMSQAKESFLRLASTADVMIESFRPGVADRLGIGYTAVRAVNEGIVYCSTSGYGQNGPYAGWAGHDLNYLALGGFLGCSTPRSDGGAPIPGATVADSAGGGMQAVIAILAALLSRARTGEGAYLDVAATEGVLSFMSLHVDQHLATGEEPGPGHDILTGRYACYDVYQARDGKWLAVGAIEPPFFANLCNALELEEWVPYQTDDARQGEIRAAFRAAFGRRDRDDWVADLGPRETCVAPVYAISELVKDRHFAARRVFVEATHAKHGRFGQLGPVLAGADRTVSHYAIRDGATTDTEELLVAAGLSKQAIEEMRRAGAIA